MASTGAGFDDVLRLAAGLVAALSEHGVADLAFAADGRAENIFRFHAKHLDELNVVQRKLESLRGVHRVRRVRDASP